MSDEPTTGSARAAIVDPCSAGTHWRRVRFFFPLRTDEFDRSRFIDCLPHSMVQDDGTVTWFVFNTDDADCHSHVELSPAQDVPDTPEDGESDPISVCGLEIDTFRSAPHDLHDASFVTHDELFAVLRSCISTEDSVTVGANTDLYFKGEDTRWRVSLLANSPGFGELSDELGTISLAGLTFRFEESTVGLRRVALDTSPFGTEYRVNLVFKTDLQSEHLALTYEKVLEQAERFAKLFIGPKAT